MSDETTKSPENGEAPKPSDKNKVTATAQDGDQTEKFRAIRRGLEKGELAF